LENGIEKEYFLSDGIVLDEKNCGWN